MMFLMIKKGKRVEMDNTVSAKLEEELNARRLVCHGRDLELIFIRYLLANKGVLGIPRH